MFKTENRKTLTVTKHCEENKAFRYDQLVEEKRKEMAKRPYNKTVTDILDKILVSTSADKEDILLTSKGEKVQLKQVTQKMLYEESLLKIHKDHHSQAKWVRKINTHIEWEDVWNTLHNKLSTNKTKNIIWQQIHLNFYTQFSYNKWHKKQEVCTLCLNIPNDIYHLILHCEFTS